MLKLLVAAGPNGMSREQLVDELWPDAEGDDGNIAFRTTLSRLRDIIGNDHAVPFFEGTLSLDQRFCRVDAWAFEQQCDSITEALQSNRNDGTDLELIRETSGRAIKLYAGSFLATDIDLAMAIPFRERLRRKYIHLISGAGRLMHDAGDFARSRDYYASGLDADPLAEELYQGLMTCNLKLGRKAEAMAAYRRCSEALKTGLDITPSRRTELLKQEILES
jgi:LuxR family transcriptional regulator, maltose regulon positive regulatory protein